MREALLALHVLSDRLVLFGSMLIGVLAVLPLVIDPHSCLNGQFGDLDGLLGIEQPALRAGRMNVHEGRALVVEGLSDLVDEINWIGQRSCRYVVHGRMSTDDQLAGILGEQRLTLGNGLARGGEGRVGAVGCRRRSLDTRVRIGLVVIHDEEGIVTSVHHTGHGLQADVNGSTVTSHADDVGEFSLVLALPDEDLIGCLDTGSYGPGVGDLGVHPGIGPGAA